MKTLLLSTAILGVAAGSAFAQEVEIFRAEADPLEIRASDLTGMRIYATETPLEADEYEGTQEGWEDIGEVNDVILTREGTVEAVLVDIGGFLGIGERQVAVSMDALRFVADSATAEDVDDYFLVTNASRATLEQAPEYVQGETTAGEAASQTEEVVEGGAAATAATGAAAGAAAGTAAVTAADAVTGGATAVGEAVGESNTAEAATEAATETEMAAEATADAATGEVATEEVATEDMAADDAATTTVTTAEPVDEAATTDTAAATTTTTTDPAAAETTTTDTAAAEATEGRTPITREGFVTAETAALTTDALQGAAVYDANDERVGEVSELLMTENGQVTDVVVDVGGFLGIGEKPVSMQLGNLDILQQEGGEEIRVYLSDTKEQLEAMPTYEN